jgi:hypothetical protein
MRVLLLAALLKCDESNWRIRRTVDVVVSACIGRVRRPLVS